MKVEGNKIRVDFTSTGTGLISRDGKDLSDFMIAGPDNNYVKPMPLLMGKLFWLAQIVSLSLKMCDSLGTS